MIKSCKINYLVYRLSFPNGKRYIGVTIDLKRRLWEHENRKDNLVGRAWAKHGTPVIQILAICEEDYAYDLERKAVIAFKSLSPYGYNLMDGGMGGRKMSEFTRQKMSKSHRGFKMTEEARQNLSESKRGKKRAPFSAEWKRRLSEGKRGKLHGPMSEKQRQKNLCGENGGA